MNGVIDSVVNAPGWVILALVFLLVFVEDALFVGFVIPGEIAAIAAGVTASAGKAPLWVALVTVMAAAVIGDSVGYQVGKTFGPRILASKMLAKRRDRLAEAQDFLARRGGMAVFLGRWVAFFRAVMPALAGMSKMPYPRFLAYNAAGGIVWSAVVVTLGYLAGNSYAQIEKSLGRVGAVVLTLLVILAVIAWRASRAKRHGDGAASEADVSDTDPRDAGPGDAEANRA